MMPFSDPRFPGDAKPSHFQLILRRRPDGKLPELDPDVGEELSQIIAYLEALRTTIKEPKLRPLPPSQLTLPEQRAFQAKRLKVARVRLGSKEPGEDILQDLALLTDSELLSDHVAAGESRVPAPKPAAPTAMRSGARWLFALVGAMLLGAAGTAAFFWMRPYAAGENHFAAANSAAEKPVPVEALRTADLVLQAIQGGRLAEASGRLAGATRRGLALPGMRYQAALLALRQGYVRTSMEWVSKSIEAHELIPESLYLRANSAASEGDHDAVNDCFQEAASQTPFNPRYFFFWAEALRRYGHPLQAMAQFERALLCRPSSADAELIRFKMGLTQIEVGADEKFDTNLRSLLDQKTVSGDALLLAAAVEINRSAYPAAAGYLRRAKEAMPAALLASRLRDFLFQARAHQPDIAAVWPAPVPAGPVDPFAPERPPGVIVVVDPATRSMAEADPAGW